MRATGPRMLNDVVDAWLNATSHQQGSTTLSTVLVAEPGVFSPDYDSEKTRVRETCEHNKCYECKGKGRRNGPLSPEQKAECDKLAKAGFSNPSVRGPEAFATHHWAHTWLGKNIYGATVSVDKVVADARKVAGMPSSGS